MHKSKGKIRVWRAKNQGLHPDCIVPREIGGGASVTVWACFSGNRGGILLTSRSTINSEKYLTFLENGLIPSLDIFGFDSENRTGFFFQQDNAPCHKSCITTTWLESHNIPLLPWPAKSPDLNPIENIWALLDNRIRRNIYEDIEDLERDLLQFFNEIPSETFQNLSNSMPDRIKKCFQLQDFTLNEFVKIISRFLTFLYILITDSNFL
jgi:hypothetical protein